MKKLLVMPGNLFLHKRALAAGGGFLVFVAVVVAAWLALRPTATALAQDLGKPTPEHMQRPKNYSPYVDRS